MRGAVAGAAEKVIAPATGVAAVLEVVESADWQDAKVVTRSVGRSRKRDRISTDFRKGGGGPPAGLGGGSSMKAITAEGHNRFIETLGGFKKKSDGLQMQSILIERVDALGIQV